MGKISGQLLCHAMVAFARDRAEPTALAAGVQPAVLLPQGPRLAPSAQLFRATRQNMAYREIRR